MYFCFMVNKELLKGTISIIILKMLEEHGRMYGYEIFQKVKELTDGKIILKDGSLYPALQRLAKDGLLTYEKEYVGKRVRKYYLLTPIGVSKKKEYLTEIQEFIETLAKVISPKTSLG